MTDYKEETNKLESQIADAECGMTYEEIVKIAILSQQRVVDALESISPTSFKLMEMFSHSNRITKAIDILKELQSRL